VSRTSTFALTNVTVPFVLALADKGLRALAEDTHLRAGLNVHDGHIAHPAVAEALDLAYLPADQLLKN
jgi:alanine dehydrogenase